MFNIFNFQISIVIFTKKWIRSIIINWYVLYYRLRYLYRQSLRSIDNILYIYIKYLIDKNYFNSYIKDTYLILILLIISYISYIYKGFTWSKCPTPWWPRLQKPVCRASWILGSIAIEGSWLGSWGQGHFDIL